MSYFIISQSAFTIIIAVETILIGLLGGKSKIVSIVLWCLLILSIMIMFLVEGFVKARYKILDKQVFTIGVIEALSYLALLLISNVAIKTYLKT